MFQTYQTKPLQENNRHLVLVFLPFSSKTKPKMDSESMTPIIDDPFNHLFSEILNLDTLPGLCNTPSSSYQFLPSYGSLLDQPMSYSSLAYSPMNVAAQDILMNDNGSGSYVGVENETMFRKNESRAGFNISSAEERETRSNDSVSVSAVTNTMMGSMSRPLGLGYSVAERMFKALSLFKESSGGGFLAQVWMPVTCGDKFLLSTCEQPYLFDQQLAGYREVSRAFTFSAIETPDSFLGLPGRVFLSKMPEWTPNVAYYSKNEYLRVQHAVDHEVRGSLALPIFGSHDKVCCAVLELVTMMEKSNFHHEMEHVCRVLQAVNLRTTIAPRVHSQCLSENKKGALAEIADILRAVCHAHSLPLALTWIPSSCSDIVTGEPTRVQVEDGYSSSNDRDVLCIEESASYVNNKMMQDFKEACTENYLKKGQGIAGKALASNHPYFTHDIKGSDIKDYPLVHHARRFGLNAAVAIRIRSTYTSTDDYILEFFLPVNCKGIVEQEQLLQNLSSTMQRLCKSLRTVSDAELVGDESNITSLQGRGYVPLTVRPGKTSQLASSDSEFDLRENFPFDGLDHRNEARGLNIRHDQKKNLERKRMTAEKSISLSTLRQYFSGSLKDAAKSLGVCPTTLKRICRQHGIARWPSRKINKVNRSLRKIQTVIDSVQGVEAAGLKFDSITGSLVGPTTMVQDTEVHSFCSSRENAVIRNSGSTKSDIISSSPASVFKAGSCSLKFGKDAAFVSGRGLDPSGNMLISDAGKGTLSVDILGGASQKRRCNNWGLGFESSDCYGTSRSSSSMAAADEMDMRRHATSSGMTDTSSGSHSSMNGSASSSPHPNYQTVKPEIEDSERITVKATYKGDTVRFKYDPHGGCLQLFHQVGKRFKLSIGTFQLKYLDDDKELVMLASESDLQECLEVLESIGSRCIKLSVRDIPSAIGSSTSSSSLLVHS